MNKTSSFQPSPPSLLSKAAGISAASGSLWKRPALVFAVLCMTTTASMASPPSVTGPTYGNIYSDLAGVNVNLTSTGGAGSVQVGVVYSRTSTNSDPYIDGTGVGRVYGLTSSTGEQGFGLLDLTPGTNYSVRGYAINGDGTVYTGLSTFDTPPLLPSISVTYSSTNILLTDGSTDPVNFGSKTVGTASRARKFTITNTGEADLTDLTISKTGAQKAEFKVTDLSKTTLIPGESTTFHVTFKPSGKRLRTATLKIGSNDSTKNPFDILLSGKGVAP